MQIIYQTELSSNPVIKPTANVFAGGDYSFTLKQLTIQEIVELENIYNNGNQFPASLREVLYLAGRYCYVLDYGLNDTQEEMQEKARQWLTEVGLAISRPFFIIDVYTGGDVFLFVYLDEGVADPRVWQANLDPYPGYPWLTMLVPSSLSAYVNSGIAKLKNGFNPY